MKKIELEEIPEKLYLEWIRKGVVQSSDDLQEEDLRKMDHQLAEVNLQVVFWENGSSLEWFIDRRSDAS